MLKKNQLGQILEFVINNKLQTSIKINKVVVLNKGPHHLGHRQGSFWQISGILKVTALYVIWNPEICPDPPTCGQHDVVLLSRLIIFMYPKLSLKLFPKIGNELIDQKKTHPKLTVSRPKNGLRIKGTTTSVRLLETQYTINNGNEAMVGKSSLKRHLKSRTSSTNPRNNINTMDKSAANNCAN